MPVVFYFKGYKFFFFSNEGDPREPVHIHVRKDAKLAKFWLKPKAQLAESHGFSAKELNRIAKIIDNKDLVKLRELGMSTLNLDALAKSVSFDSDNMWVELVDGRQLGVPLAYFPRLAQASPAQRKKFSISGGGIGLHWDQIDEDISVPALLTGKVDRSVTLTKKKSAA